MNIVQLNEFEKARTGVTRQEAVGLLRECREVAFCRLSAAMTRMLAKVDDTLFEWAEKSQQKPDQNLYFDAMRAVRLKRASMEIAFKTQLVEGFNREIRKESDSSSESLLAEQMTLVDDDGLEEGLAVENMVNKVEVECKQELHHLNRRVGVLLNDPDLTRAKNPIGPEIICGAFREACADLDSGIKVKLIVMKLFDRHVVDEEIKSLYHEINRLLIDRGILSDLRYDVKRVPGNAKGPNTPDADSEEGDEDLYATLQKLMLRGAPAGGMASAAVIGTLVGQLTQLQQGRADAAGGSLATLDQNALTSGTVNIIHDIKTSGAMGDLGATDGMVIDVIAMLFDYVFDDVDIPPTMKALIGRLQIPMLKVGMLDKTFFSRRSHPARKLLNALAHASVGWNARTDQALHDKIASVVQRVLDGFEQDIELFSVLIDEFEAFLAAEKERAAHREEQSAGLVRGTERLRLAKQRVRIEVERRNRGMLPTFARHFLVSYWQNLLLVTFVKEGEDSVAWKRSLTAMDNLVWSLQPKATVLERDRLVKLLPSLLRVLRDGMQLISMRDADFQSFLGQLAECHAGIVNAVPRSGHAANDADEVPIMAAHPLAYAGGDEPVVEDKAIMTATIHQLVVSGDLQAEETAIEDDETPFDEIEDEYLVQARDLKQGGWVEFNQEDGTAVRAKLTWVSPVTGVYLFTNRQGLKTADKTLQGLAAELRNGTARLLDDAPLFERAVSSVIDGLRKTGTSN
ncbi:MAG: DUF1631 domain-containing protein [Thiohalobacteraceae bacterium]